jgi:uncharacterized protein (TIGR02145 family)
MKTVTGVLFLAMLAVQTHAQNYQLTFSGNGASSVVDSVKVENLSQCTILSMAGDDTLLLTTQVGFPENKRQAGPSLFVTPNPSPGVFRASIEISDNSPVSVGLWDVCGKALIYREDRLAKGTFDYDLSQIPAGSYLLTADDGKSVNTVRLISTLSGNGTPEMKRSGGSHNAINQRPVSFTNLVYMPFYPGDTLKITGRSGDYRTVVMLFPVSSQNVNFTFTACTDADSNHYAVVQIGSQLWMQENLKTTKYRDGSDIPNVTDSAAWSILTTGAYCNFRNKSEEGEKYGRLYNFYAVNDSRKICPSGWHAPSHSEWKILEKYLDPTVDTTALMGTGRLIGRILKEGCDTRWQYWDTTCGFNSAGFTALCANFRSATGGWSLAPGDNHDSTFWTATPYTASSAWSHGLRWCYSDIYVIFPMNRSGFSLRCVRDN